MKSLVLLSLIFLFQSSAFAQWNILPNIPTTDDLFSISIPSNNIGYAAGHNVIMKSIDGGSSWSNLNIPLTLNTYWKSAHFINDTVGFVTGINGFIKTNDGGLTWEGSEINTGYYTSTYFINDSIGFLTSENNCVLKTIDSGDNWTSQELVTNNSALVDIFFLNSDTGYCVGYQEIGLDRYAGKIFKTEDAGEVWIENTTSAGKLNEIRFINDDFGIAVGHWGYISITHDGGSNWNQQNICDTCVLTSVLIRNDSSIIIAGYTPVWIEGGNPQLGVAYYSSDSGSNWNQISIPTTSPLQSISTNGTNKILCVGYDGTILVNNDGSLIIVGIEELQLDKFDISIYPNPACDITNLKYKLYETSSVNIEITDCLGKQIKQNFYGKENQGIKLLPINLNNEKDGIYYCTITINEQRFTKMIVKYSL